MAAYRKEADARLADFKANIDGKDYTDWREAQAYLREHDDRRIKVENDQGEMVEKAAPLDVTINGERYTARAAMADAFSQLRGDVDPIIWSVGDNTMRRRTEIEKAISYINAIVNTAVNGGDPMTVEEPAGGCSGSCSSCSGCH